MSELQRLPYLGTAEDDVLFAEWLVDEGSVVHKGQPLANVETLKASFMVDAEHDGVLLRRLVGAGERVPVQAAIAVVGAAGEPSDDAVVERLLAKAPTARDGVAHAAPPVAATSQPVLFAAAATKPAAPAARRRAAELGIELQSVVGTGPDGMIRLADVERAAGAPPPPPSPAIATAGGAGTVDAEFLALLRRDAKAFGALASDFKIALYRRHGAQLGADCRLGAGVVLLTERLVLGDGAFVGADTTVEARELVAGRLLHLGARCRVRCTRIHCGDNAFFADDVEIGGGGALDPEAWLEVGSHGFVGEHVHLNPCRHLRLGDEVVVSRNAVLMTHSFGPSWLRGYPSRFAGITVGDGAQIGIGAVLFPGVEVGAGAVVLSASSVVTAVPAGRLFGGVPAVDMKAAAQQLSPGELIERAHALVSEFGRQLTLRGLPVVVTSTAGGTAIELSTPEGRRVLQFAATPTSPVVGTTVESILVAVTFPDAEFAAVPATTTAFGLEPPRVRGPLGPLAASFREFLRKRGVRCEPRAWTYPGGFL